MDEGCTRSLGPLKPPGVSEMLAFDYRTMERSLLRRQPRE